MADLTDRQRKLIEALHGAGELSKVFEAGALLRNCDGFPARAYMIAHAAREMINRLPDYYNAAGEDTEPGEPSDRTTKIIGQHQEAWRVSVRPLISEMSDEAIEAAPAVAIPRPLVTALDAVFIYEASVPGKRRRRLGRFLATLQPNSYIAGIDEVAEAFVKIPAEDNAHVPGPGGSHNESDTIDLWDWFEELLFRVLGPRHEVYVAIQRELDELNQYDG